MSLTKHTAVVNIYLEQKASKEELKIFKETIDKRLNTYPYVGHKNPNGLSLEVIEYILDRRKLYAVKQHKDETGLDLKEAKDQIDDFERINNL
jgi:ribosomal protein L7/L12